MRKNIADKVKVAIDGVVRKEQPRLYLGMSIIGDPCPRKVWYTFRWACKIELTARIQRLFHHGNVCEDVFIQLLNSVGHTVVDQQKTISVMHGHFQGHIDGILEKEHALLEVKTHNLKNFQRLTKIRNIRKLWPKYYGQIQLYMHYLGLRKTLHANICKDNDAIYLEEIKYDKTAALLLINVAKDIIFSNTVPPRCGETSDYWLCRFCTYSAVCFGKKPYAQNCRTCRHSRIQKQYWICRKRNKKIKPKKQQKGCANWESI